MLTSKIKDVINQGMTVYLNVSIVGWAKPEIVLFKENCHSFLKNALLGPSLDWMGKLFCILF